MNDGAEFTDPVEELLADCLARSDEERDAALEAACREHPEHAAELRERLAILRALGMEGPGDEDRYPDTLGDFELLQCLGKGGMGVVYEARQISLDRRVALKLIRPEHLYFPGARQRFRRETETIARLQHPGIVPVYTVGEAEGIPYFAMERIRGCTLAEVLEFLSHRQPASLHGRDLARAVRMLTDPGEGDDGLARFEELRWTAACVEVTRQVAEALQHAHQRGVIHRDVKPSNIALTLDGRAMLLDFGLTATTGNPRLTRTGSRLGTLYYMPPEQLRGVRTANAGGDVYSLGVTLYQMLTLQVPYRGDSSQDIERSILAGRPLAVRDLHRSVPADLETVALFAMDVDPSRRYADMTAFLRDLEHLRRRRPIEARAPGVWLRSRRFCQRHPALTTGVVLGALLAGGVPGAILWQQQASLKQVRAALHSEQRALARAREQARFAETSLQFIHDLLDSSSPYETLGQDLSALELLRRSSQQIQTELADIPGAQARIRLLVGSVLRDHSVYGEAEPHLRFAVEHYRAHPGDIERAVFAEALVRLGEVFTRLGQFESGRPLLEEAVQIGRELDDPELQFLTTTTYASLVLEAGDADLAVETLPPVLREAELAGIDPELVAVQWSNLGNAWILKGDPVEAERCGRRALRLVGPAATPDRAQMLLLHANQLRAAERDDEAIARFEVGLAMARSLWPEGHSCTGSGTHNLATLYFDQQDFARAAPLYEEAAQLNLRLLGRDNPHTLFSHIQHARCLGAMEGPAVAAERLDGIRPWAEEVFGREHPSYGAVLRMLGSALQDSGEEERSLELHDQAALLMRDQPGYEIEVVEALLGCARSLDAGEEFQPAEAALLEALQVTESAGLDPDRVLAALVEFYTGWDETEQAAEYQARRSQPETPGG